MGQKANLEWRDGTIPVSTVFDDPYFSLDNGLAETQHVFLQGNDLPERAFDGFRVGELGFGTGLNFLTLCLQWPQDMRLYFTSFEAFPMQKSEASRALDQFPEVAPFAVPLLDQWEALSDGPVQISEKIELNVIVGDARQTLCNWEHKADAWFLDGFSPAKNPELWEPDLMAQIGKHTASNGTLATYTAAGHVRRSLEAAGFDVIRTPGFGRKRHMTRGTLR